MIFSKPIAFAAALARRAVQAILPTNMSSAELSRLSAAVRERSLFSARTIFEDHLTNIGGVIDQILQGNMNPAKGRELLQDSLAQTDYDPKKKEGTLQDLGSDERLDLIIKTNVEMARGYGQWREGQDESVLLAYPAQELYRLEKRKEPRNWHLRWLNAAGEVGDAAAAAALRNHGKMVAAKDSAIWTALSAFGTPYPPFDFNSGMDVRDVGYKQAVALGVIVPGQIVQPQRRGFELDLN